MRDALKDGFTGSSAMDVALAVRKGLMTPQEADARDPEWRGLLGPDAGAVLDEVVVRAPKPDWLHRQKSRIAYGLHDLFTPPDRAGGYHALEGGDFEPGDGVADMGDLRRQQARHGRISSKRVLPQDVPNSRKTQQVPQGVTLEGLAQEMALMQHGSGQLQRPEGLMQRPGDFPLSGEDGTGAWVGAGLRWVSRASPGGAWDFIDWQRARSARTRPW
jgi:hypothetical protein